MPFPPKYRRAEEKWKTHCLKEAYPNLREKDYQFCMLVRLKFPNKDLANMCGISEPSLKQKLVDYKERLKVPDGGLSFKQFISKF